MCVWVLFWLFPSVPVYAEDSVWKLCDRITEDFKRRGVLEASHCKQAGVWLQNPCVDFKILFSPWRKRTDSLHQGHFSPAALVDTEPATAAVVHFSIFSTFFHLAIEVSFLKPDTEQKKNPAYIFICGYLTVLSFFFFLPNCHFTASQSSVYTLNTEQHFL